MADLKTKGSRRGRPFNRTIYETFYKKLKSLTEGFEQVLSGKSTVKELAETLGMTSMQLQRTITSSDGVLNLTGIRPSAVKSIYEDSLSPYELLIHHVLGEDFIAENYNSPVLYLAEGAEKHLVSVLKDKLNPKEYQAISSYYGFTEPAKTLTVIGIELGCTTEYVRQLKESALKKLKVHIVREYMLHLGVSDMGNVSYTCFLSLLEQKEREIKSLKQQLYNLNNHGGKEILVPNVRLINLVTGETVEVAENIYRESSVRVLGLSPKVTDLLANARYLTVGNLLKLDDVSELYNVPRFGVSEVEEVRTKLKSLGLN